MIILVGSNLSLHWGFFQFSSWIVDYKLTKPKDWSALCKLCMPVFIGGDWKLVDVRKLSSVKIKKSGQTFQGDVCYKGSSGSGLREPLLTVALALISWDLMILVVTIPISLYKTPFREFQLLATCGHQKPPHPTKSRACFCNPLSWTT